MTKGTSDFLSGTCPNPNCQKKLFFPKNGVSIECSGCGQQHVPSQLNSLGKQTTLLDVLEGLLFQLNKDAVVKETHKVNDLSNYQCSLLSSLMTYYGMDKATGKARLLTEMGKNSVFDCGQLCDRAFLIDSNHLNVSGYGMDHTGSDVYLEDTLNVIKSYNDNEERLVPIHADGDGHCLVHAVSRAMVGWELFWHPLRVNLGQHFVTHLEKYKLLFKDFIEDDEWPSIIHECDPEFVPSGAEPTGLRNIHIFGLANVLRRPIILLDSIEGIKSSGDYSAIFLPYFSPPSACKNKEGVLNKPLCIAWSSQGRNHFIPLVGVKGKKCPVLSRHIIQRAWGVNDIEIDKYVDFQDGLCQIGGEKTLQIGYIQRLAKAMGEIFFEQRGIAASLVADTYLDIFKPSGLVFGVNMEMLLGKTKESIAESQLFICLACHHLTMAEGMLDSWFVPGGKLYEIAVYTHKTLKDGFTYTFPMHDVVATFSAALNKLIPERKTCKPSSCPSCSNSIFRNVKADHSICYENGDRTLTKSGVSKSGYKNYWYGKEYSSIPKSVKVIMEWKGTVVVETVPWFQDDEDPSLNSNVYQIAQDLVQTKFPGEFGSERLVQKVVDQILFQTNDPIRSQALPAFQDGKGEEGMTRSSPVFNQQSPSHPERVDASSPGLQRESFSDGDLKEGAWSPGKASKAILTGFQSQSIHKEELNKSKSEAKVKQRIEKNASKQQSKLTDLKSKTVATNKRSESASGSSDNKMESSKSSIPMSVSAPSISASAAHSPKSHPTQSRSIDSLASGDGEKISPMATSTHKRVRLCLSDGKNITVELSAECTFSELQDMISKHTDVNPQRLKILHGFPPMELKPPSSEQGDYVIPIRSGDKVMVNVIAQEKQESVPADTWMPQLHGMVPNRDGQTTNSFGAGKDNEARDTLLQQLIESSLQAAMRAAADNTDETVNLLKYTAALCKKDLWTYVQAKPHLFSVNGLFYQQATRDVKVDHGKHVTLSAFPEKVFAYNKHDDRIELCLHPYGHFAVEQNVEMNAHSLKPSFKCGSKAGSRPFSGQGHSLRCGSSQEDRMPTDIPMSPKRSEARPLNMFCDPNCHQESIEEEDEGTEEADRGDTQGPAASSHSHQLRPHELLRSFLPATGVPTMPSTPPSSGGTGGKLVRKGPGYSELSPIPETALSNEKPEGLHELVSRIEQAVEVMGKQADKIGDTIPTHSNSPLSTESRLFSYLSSIGKNSHSPADGSSESRETFDSETERTSTVFVPTSPGANTSPSTPPHSPFVSSVISPTLMTSAAINHVPSHDRLSTDQSLGSDSTSSKADDIQQPMEAQSETLVPNPVVVYAEQFASDIAAMDTESRVEDCDCERLSVKIVDQNRNGGDDDDDEDMKEREEEEKLVLDDILPSDSCTETPMISESKA